MKTARKKFAVHATISPLSKQQLDDLLNSHHLFSSGSDVVDKAISMLYYAIHQDSLANNAEALGISAHSRYGL